jgi:response regulator RpfG family c-di-GMP phosphodiesterase
LHKSKSKLLIGDDKDFLKYYDVMIGHHKAYDGKDGYPSDFDNTKSKYKIAIDLITIADTIDAATDVLGRNYTSGKSFKKVLDELIEQKGTRYNPFLVDFIANNAKLKKELDDLTGKDRVNVYFDVYKTIIYS